MARARCSRQSAPPATSRRSCSRRRLRCYGAPFRLPSPTTFISPRSPPTARKRRSANCCSPTTPARHSRRRRHQVADDLRAARQTEQGCIRLLLRHHPRTACRPGGLLPVAESVRHTHASPRAAVGFLIHAAGLTREQTRAPHQPRHARRILHGRRTNRRATPRRRRQSGRAHPPRAGRTCPAHRRRLGRTARCHAGTRLGFKAEAAFDDIIRAHIEDELGGKIAN